MSMNLLLFLYGIMIGSYIFVILIRRKFCQFPLVSLIIVVVYPVINDHLDFFKVCTLTDINLIFHMFKETFLRCIVPTVSTTAH